MAYYECGLDPFDYCEYPIGGSHCAKCSDAIRVKNECEPAPVKILNDRCCYLDLHDDCAFHGAGDCKNCDVYFPKDT